MIRLKNLLFEMARAPIYHSTSIVNAAKIVNSNTLARAKLEFDPTAEFGSFRLKTVLHPGIISFSRDPKYRVQGATSHVVFQLDTDKVRQHYKMTPRVGTDLDFRFKQYQVKREAEEGVVGPIKPLDAYLMAIYIDKKAYKELEGFATSKYTKDEYIKLYKHPKLTVR